MVRGESAWDSPLRRVVPISTNRLQTEFAREYRESMLIPGAITTIPRQNPQPPRTRQTTEAIGSVKETRQPAVYHQRPSPVFRKLLKRATDDGWNQCLNREQCQGNSKMDFFASTGALRNGGSIRPEPTVFGRICRYQRPVAHQTVD